jgi:hypothetical protein
VDVEFTVWALPIGFPDEFILKFDQVIFE